MITFVHLFREHYTADASLLYRYVFSCVHRIPSPLQKSILICIPGRHAEFHCEHVASGEKCDLWALLFRCYAVGREAQEYLSRQPVGFGGPSVEGIRQWGLWWYGTHCGIQRSNICYKLGGWFSEGRTPRLVYDSFTILASWVPLNSNMMVVVLILDGHAYNN